MLMEPFSPLFVLSRGIDRQPPRNGAVVGIPAADVVATDDLVTVTMDVPGLSAGDLEIELEGDVITVRGERKYPYATDGETRGWQRIERGFGKFERSLQVPRGLSSDAIEASLNAGVLTLRIPKPEPLKPKPVQIGTGKTEDARQLAGASA